MILLYDNLMSGKQIGQIISILRKNDILEGLYLSGNKFDHEDAHKECAKLISKAVSLSFLKVDSQKG